MQVLSSTFIALFLVALMIRRGPFQGMIILFLLMPFGMMAAFNLPALGNTTILGTDLAVLALGIMFLFRSSLGKDLGRLFAPGGVSLPLMGFLLYAIMATVFFPRIFAGETEVFSIGRVANQIGIISRPLSANVGNLSQLIRILLSLTAFAVCALVMIHRQDPALGRRAMVTVTVTHLTLGFIDIATQATNTAFLMEPIRTATYSLTLGQEMAGLNRVIGGFPEASTYSYMTLGLLGFWLSYWFNDRSGARLPLVLMLLLLFMLLRGTSSSAYVGFVLLLTIFVTTRLVDMAKSGGGALDQRLVLALAIAVALIPLLMMSAYTLYSVSSGFADFIDKSLLTKLSSDSGVERMSWNRQALINFYETYLLGAGLGSVRASNWLVATLGTTGLIGTLLFLAFMWRMFRVPLTGLEDDSRLLASALKMGCAGCMARAMVVKGTPNLDFLFFGMAGMLVGLGLTAAAITKRRRKALAEELKPEAWA